MTDKENNMIKLCGLWNQESKAGNKYLSGKLSGGVKIMVMKNKFKETEKHPDYQVYIAPFVKKETTDSDDKYQGHTETPKLEDIPF